MISYEAQAHLLNSLMIIRGHNRTDEEGGRRNHNQYSSKPEIFYEDDLKKAATYVNRFLQGKKQQELIDIVLLQCLIGYGKHVMKIKELPDQSLDRSKIFKIFQQKEKDDGRIKKESCGGDTSHRIDQSQIST